MPIANNKINVQKQYIRLNTIRVAIEKSMERRFRVEGLEQK
jgi:hypothetical protein